MCRFNIGDRVVIIKHPRSEMVGREGIVVNANKANEMMRCWMIGIKTDYDGRIHHFKDDRLELVDVKSAI